MDHFCVPCDVETMAYRANLDKRRVQQIAKDHQELKNAQGEYNCPMFMRHYTHALQKPKRSGGGVSALTKKQEESLEIRNARDRAEVLAEWGTMVLRDAVISELAPMIVSLKNGLREIPSIQARQIVLLVKECVDLVTTGVDLPNDHDLFARALKMMSEPQDEKMKSFEKDLKAWTETAQPQGKPE